MILIKFYTGSFCTNICYSDL